MNYKDEIVEFVVNGYKNHYNQIITENHRFVLKEKNDNFITLPPKDFKYHIHARSLKSSQAFAYNVFSGVNNPTLQFEFPMKVFDKDAQIDVMFENVESQTIELFEVKFFEITHLGTKKNIFKEKYFNESKYIRSDIAAQFIDFLDTVIKEFEDKRIYSSGVKQLCSHLLGILNIMNITDYADKKFKLYSFCFDDPFSIKFKKDLENYKDTLTIFKKLVDKLLKELKVDARVEYYGFLSATEYITNSKELLGKENYDYVMKRYFQK
ncbi:hypothetical protein GON26_17010 [Flavobacterium sp. GA093]|uniref:Uncharacterized protein n=1 Tax=Flavobacterium hydrocarbonoxydans TaxID=2683249 RepID=A0A6I4NNP6_9FLAO|nr:hypothetical protein [Flavobacterium hydrocarbonoxydans]MWB96068.1 hypothetical protein [Flavobacterium hydrocarbonoxydans]